MTSKKTLQKQTTVALKYLINKFPDTFSQTVKMPLKIGIVKDVVALLYTKGDETLDTPPVNRAAMRLAVGKYANDLGYLSAITVGAIRVDLEGKPAGLVTEAEAEYSIKLIKDKIAWLKEKNMKQTRQPKTENAKLMRS